MQARPLEPKDAGSFFIPSSFKELKRGIPDETVKLMPLKWLPSAAARKSKGKRQKAKVLIDKALTIFALVGYFCRAALVVLFGLKTQSFQLRRCFR